MGKAVSSLSAQKSPRLGLLEPNFLLSWPVGTDCAAYYSLPCMMHTAIIEKWRRHEGDGNDTGYPGDTLTPKEERAFWLVATRRKIPHSTQWTAAPASSAKDA